MDKIHTKLLKDFSRFDLVSLLEGNRNTRIELGVAEGEYSERLINSGKFSKIYGVDCYD